MVDVIDLRIEAENVASERLVQVAEDVTGLGRAATRAQQNLDDLEITRGTLNSFQQAQERVSGLEEEITATTVALQRSQQELRDSAEATDEQRRAVARQQTTLRRLRSDLTASNRELRNLGSTLRTAGVSTDDLAESQATLNRRIEETAAEASRLSNEYDRQTNRLRDRIEAQREVNDAEEQAQRTAREARTEAERAAAAEAERLSAQRRATEAQSRLTIATSRYEQELTRLNRALNDGSITRGNYIRAEAQLRRQLNLTSAQISTNRQAIEADTRVKTRNVEQTRALSGVVRTLAAAYVALESAQQAAQQVGASVSAYGQLEAAITDVARTTGIARDDVIQLAETIREFGEDITPTATNELLRYAEVAGQLGVDSTQDLLRLVAAADQLNVATNIAGDEAATLLTRMLEVTGQGVPAIGNLSSAVVQLGNNFAAQESEIVDFGRQLVTSTREIDLSAEAALALGTALAVSGSQAESSRTAIGRLSQAIRRAATEGGDSLERLAEITGQTGEQIQENLGGQSEQIILDFVAGLARVQEQGGVTLDVLRQFGIDGQEASAVFGSLASNVDVLRDAINQSNAAYQDGTAQIREASQAYANQESAVGRLRNAFTGLQSDIGLAFSDETDQAIRLITNAIDGTNDEVIRLAELLPGLVDSFGDVIDIADNLFAIFGTDGVGAFEALADSAGITFNLLTNGINLVIGSVQQLILSIGEGTQELAALFGQEFDSPYLDGLRQAIDETRNDIISNNTEISQALDRLNGESSRSYQDLLNTVDLYRDSLGRLSDSEQAQIEQIINKNGFVEGQDRLYQQLTANLVRANRAAEIEAAQIQQTADLRRDALQAQIDETNERERTVQAVNDNIAANVNLVESTAELQQRVNELNQLERDGVITKEQLANFTEVLNNQIRNQGGLQEELNTANERAAVVNEQLTATARTLLVEQGNLLQSYQDGLITLPEYIRSQAELESRYSLNLESTRALTGEQVNLQVQIDRTNQTITTLNAQLQSEANSKQDLARITAQLRNEEQALLSLRQQQVAQNEIANASFSQLNTIRERTIQQLDSLNAQFRAGSISTGQFLAQQRELQGVLSQINGILGTNTVAIEQNTQATVRNVQAKQQQTQAIQATTSALSLELQAQQALNQSYDFSNSSISELSSRYDELQGMILDNLRVSDPWLRNLAEISNEVFTQEQAYISNEIALRRYTEQIRTGNVDLRELGDNADFADRAFTNLSQQQLSGLQNAISEASQDFQQLDDQINRALLSTQDRLDRIRGDEAAIVARQFERERAELDALLEQALTEGNNVLVNRVREAIRNLQLAQREELDAQTQRDTTTRRTRERRDTATPANNTGANRANGGTINVNITTATGTLPVQVADQQSANNLLTALTDAGLVSLQGNN